MERQGRRGLGREREGRREGERERRRKRRGTCLRRFYNCRERHGSLGFNCSVPSTTTDQVVRYYTFQRLNQPNYSH